MRSNGDLMIETPFWYVNDYLKSTFYQLCMRVQKRYVRIIQYVGKDGRGDYFDVKLLYFIQEI